MASKRRARILPTLLLLGVLSGVLGSAKAAGAFVCTANGTFHGSSRVLEGKTVWDWTFSAHGTCRQVLKVYVLKVYAWKWPNQQFPGPVTFSANDPYGSWEISTSLTGPSTKHFWQAWFGVGQQAGAFSINSWDPSIPNQQASLGPQTGEGIVHHKNFTGPASNPTIKATFAFAFAAG